MPSSIFIKVLQSSDKLIFGIQNEMGICTAYIGTMENPLETAVITPESPVMNITEIEQGEYPLILVTEGHQIFQGMIGL